MKLKKVLILLAIPALQMLAMPAFAQTSSPDASAPKDRKEVKAETKAANKGGALHSPNEEVGTPPTADSAGSTKTRKQVKEEAKAANKSGELRQGGEAGVATDKPTGSTKTRAEVKAEAKQANLEKKDKPKSPETAQ